jgi:hypothetical protein
MVFVTLILIQRLTLLAEAADRCSTIPATDLPPSASEPVVQLRFMGDFSITSEDCADDNDFEEHEACGFIIFFM